jgi:hypothetical protein
MFALFHPENGTRVDAGMEFPTADEAKDFQLSRVGRWEEIPSKNDDDKVALISSLTGAIVVVREIN